MQAIQNPSATLLHNCMTKATTAEGDALRHSQNWVMARRAILQVWSDRLVCGDWTIPHDSIREAVLYSIRSSFFIPGYVLRVRTDDRTFQFGLNAGKFWRGDLPFPVSRERGRLSYSPFSLVIRLIIIGYLLYYVWTQFIQ
jgi:hypothetical protein